MKGVNKLNTVEPIRGKDMIIDIAEILKSYSERDYVLFMTGIYIGRRISDILPLRVSDVKDKDYIYFREKKTGKETNIIINKKLKSIYKQYCKDKKLNEYLFPPLKGKKNRHITRQQYWNILQKAAQDLGYGHKIGCHSMRKSLGRKLYEDGVDVAVIMMILGHDDIKTTKRYIGVTGDEINSILSKVDFG